MTPLATRLRDLMGRCRTKKLKGSGGLLLSHAECEAVLNLLDAAKQARADIREAGWAVTYLLKLTDSIGALEKP